MLLQPLQPTKIREIVVHHDQYRQLPNVQQVRSTQQRQSQKDGSTCGAEVILDNCKPVWNERC